MAPFEFTIGQAVFVKYNDPRSHRAQAGDDGLIEAKVTKIGRKWVSIDYMNDRFDCATLRLDAGNYTSLGCVFLSRQHHLDTVMRDEKWRELRALCNNYTAPAHLTFADLQKICDKVRGLANG